MTTRRRFLERFGYLAGSIPLASACSSSDRPADCHPADESPADAAPPDASRPDAVQGDAHQSDAAQPDATPFDAMDWQSVRREFDLDPDWIHFAGFLHSSHPRPVREAIDRHRRRFDRNPAIELEAGDRDFFVNSPSFAHEEAVRAKAGEYLGVGPTQVALVPSTTAGLGLLYHGLPLRAGQEVLTTRHEHYSSAETFRLRSLKDGAVVRQISLFDDAGVATVSKSQIVDRIAAAVTASTRILALTWVHSGTGLKIPAAEIGQLVADINQTRGSEDKVVYCLDGVHGLGIEDFTFGELGCDYFVSGTHKWMYGPRGTGIICATANSAAAGVIPSFSGRGAFGVEMTPGGYHTYEHVFAMKEAFEFHLAIGKERIQERIRLLNQHLKEQLRAIPEVELVTPEDPELSSGFTFFRLDGIDRHDFVTSMRAQQIVVSSADRDAGPVIRVAPGIINTTAEIDMLVAAIIEMIGNR